MRTCCASGSGRRLSTRSMRSGHGQMKPEQQEIDRPRKEVAKLKGERDIPKMAAAFFSSLKTERTARKVYRTRDDARVDVVDYIERFYNPQRRHSTLGYLSSVEFEESARSTAFPKNRQHASADFSGTIFRTISALRTRKVMPRRSA